MILPSSFRDSAGFVFSREGTLYRQVNKSFQDHFDHFLHSGLYETLVERQLIIPHEIVAIPPEDPVSAYKIIRPFPIPFISYPYEWSFSQLKDAALLTLEVQKISLDYGMVLKDATAYNVQFFKGQPIFIDTLSFEKYQPGKPWIAYRQFCQQFLCPLALMHYTDIRLGQLLRTDIDGISLDLTSKLLPGKTWLNPGILMHIHLHARSVRKYAGVHAHIKSYEVSKNALIGLLDNLTTRTNKLQWQPEGTEWAEYYQDTNYSSDAFAQKKEIVAGFLESAHPKTVWDMGANTGFFSRLASTRKIPTVAFDIDPACVEVNYREVRKNKEQDLLPLLLDVTNPSPGVGWLNEERDSLIRRGPADCVLALALIHHLAITNNVPFDRIAAFFSEICDTLIIEFVPKSDSQVQKLLMNREDIFNEYTQECFEACFNRYFDIVERTAIVGSSRTLYFMKTRSEE